MASRGRLREPSCRERDPHRAELALRRGSCERKQPFGAAIGETRLVRHLTQVVSCAARTVTQILGSGEQRIVVSFIWMLDSVRGFVVRHEQPVIQV